MLLVAALKGEAKFPSVVGFLTNLTNCVFIALHIARLPRFMCRSFLVITY